MEAVRRLRDVIILEHFKVLVEEIDVASDFSDSYPGTTQAEPGGTF